jgi:arsenate reductase
LISLMTKKRILFLCIGNCCRSQMAEGFGKRFAQDKFEIYSAGSHPAGFVSEDAIEVMKEVEIDISGQKSKGFDDLPVKEFDYVISLGCKDVCPFYPAKEKIDWDIQDPIGQPLKVFRSVRDNIEEKIKGFLASHS